MKKDDGLERHRANTARNTIEQCSNSNVTSPAARVSITSIDRAAAVIHIFVIQL